MKRVLGLLVFSCFSLAAIGQQTINASAMVDGTQRDYTMYIPASYSSNTPAPLVFCFHGYTSTSAVVKARAAFEPIADTAGFIAVFPQGSALNNLSHWNVGGWTAASIANDIGFTAAMIDSISANYNVDAKRIYSTGFSNGGFFSYQLACQMSDKIAAIASVSGSMTDMIANNCNAQRPVPVLQIHGTNDAVIGYNGSQLAGSYPIDDVIDFWVKHNKCNTTPVTNAIADANTTDGSTVELIAHKGGDKGSSVELLKVTNGAHEWPGDAGNMDISASLEIWKFFSRYTLDGAVVSIKDVQYSVEGLSISPNPAMRVADVSFHAANSCVEQISIIDAHGRVLWQRQVYCKAGNNNVRLDVSGLVGGMYIVSIQNEQKKLLIQ